MKKKIYLLITLLFIFIPVLRVGATGISASPNSVTLTTGGSQTITVTVTNLAALMDITTSNSSVASIDKAYLDLTSNGSGSVSGTFKITGNSAGSAVITIKTKDAADFTNGDDYNQTIKINVTVNKPTTTTTTTTTTRPATTNPPQTPTTQATTRTNPQVERPTEVITEPVVEAPTEAVTEEATIPMRDENLNGIDDDIEFKSLKIVGYPIEFDSKVNTYTINVGNANALYISSSPLTEGATIDLNGEINIENLDKLVLTLKYNDKSSTITINLNRTSNVINIEPSPKTDEKSSSLITIVAITGIVTSVVFGLAFIFKEKQLALSGNGKVEKLNDTGSFLDNLKVCDPIDFSSNNKKD